MSILTANLKHYHQWRGFWLVYLFLAGLVYAAIAIPLTYGVAGKGSYIGLAVLAFFVGFLVTVMQIEVLTKPFSYCLVGQREVVRKVIFFIAMAVNLLGSMLFVIYPGLGPLRQLVVVCSAFFAGLTFYLLGVVLVFTIKNSAVAIWLFVLFEIIGRRRFDLHVILERAIVQYPYAVICVGIVTSAVVWVWLGRADLARRYCNVPMMSIFDYLNREKVQKYNAAKKVHKLKGHPRPWVEKFFLGRMDKYDYLGDGRYVWGVLYNHFAIIVSKWKFFAVALVSLAIVSGYMIHMIIFVVIVLPATIMGHQRPPTYSSMPIFGGRRQRFVSTVVLGVASIALACAAVLIMAGLSTQLARFMPEIAHIGSGRKLVFRIIDARFVFVPLLAMPFFLTMQLVFYRKPVYGMLLFMLLGFPMMFALFLPPGIGWRDSIMAIITDRGSVAGIAVVGWLIFFLVLRYICEKRCLVGQGRSH
jgi:hypothetical protein